MAVKSVRKNPPGIYVGYIRQKPTISRHGSSTVLDILQDNGISSIRLFNTDLATLSTFSGTPTIHLTIGVPNELLPTIAATLNWLQSNLLAHIPANQICYIAVGNEVFLKDPYHTHHVLLTILKLHQALQTLGLDIYNKLSSLLNASVLSTSYPPSSTSFEPSRRGGRPVEGWPTGRGEAVSAENTRAYDAEVVRQLPINHIHTGTNSIEAC
ncbi:hypothetical protein DVH24_040856 [Malus domestica]|uniref:glucan endo-1,3-beta-D-glucosidase n=1 Tax=Malus domestica TaxID=3750 RepID=A0A498I9W0_MALDO|nr:hypothetical protein DVH24_040856 [Malus domestica]